MKKNNPTKHTNITTTRPVRLYFQRLFATSVFLACGVIYSADASALSLKQAMEAAYEQNPVVRGERENLAATDERVAQAVSEFRPSAYIDYGRGRQSLSFAGSNKRYTDRETRQLLVEQPIFDGFGSMSRYRAAKLQVDAGREQLSAVTQNILLAATSAYLDVLQDKAVQVLSRDNVQVLHRQLEATQSRFDVGEVTRTDVAQSRARALRAEAEKAQADGALASSVATFQRIIGMNPVVLEEQRVIPHLPSTLEEALTVALDNNPELRRAGYTKEALDKQVDANKAALLPSLSLQGVLRRETGAGITGGNDFDNDSLLLNLRVPLYQSGAEHSRVREARQNFHRARYEVLDANNEVIERVTRAWEGLKSSSFAIRANQDAIEAATIALDGVQQEQQYGARTVLDVLDAEQELYIARVNLVRAQRNQLVAAYTLLAEMGQLTPEALGLDVRVFNPKENYERVRFRPVGW